MTERKRDVWCESALSHQTLRRNDAPRISNMLMVNRITRSTQCRKSYGKILVEVINHLSLSV